jgi:hypothetical protein
VIPPRPARPGRAAARALAVLAILTTTLAGCIGGDQSTGPTTAPSASAALASPSSVAPSPTLQPSPSSSPTEVASGSPAPSDSPAASESSSAGPSLPPEEAVAACAGDEKNRAFFLDASKNLDWPVYCPVLPGRWFVTSGSYSGRGVGQLQIGYRGPGGATLMLQQGAFCETSDGCVPAGNDTGDASFGDMQGTLVAVDDGGHAIVVGRAETPSWLAVATGMDEATFRQIAADFIRLD